MDTNDDTATVTVTTTLTVAEAEAEEAAAAAAASEVAATTAESTATTTTVASAEMATTTKQPAVVLATISATTDLYQICRLCLNTLNADEGESVFNNQVPSLPEKIYRVFGVSGTRINSFPLIMVGYLTNGRHSTINFYLLLFMAVIFVNRMKILLTDR